MQAAYDRMQAAYDRMHPAIRPSQAPAQHNVNLKASMCSKLHTVQIIAATNMSFKIGPEVVLAARGSFRVNLR
jgi:hypothetical protein